MTLVLPRYRNGFHPAWLLLPLPPLLELFVDALPHSSLYAATFVRILLSLVLIVPLTIWRLAEAPPVLRRVLAEIRSQMPGFFLAVVMPGLLGVGHSSELAVPAILFFAVGCLLMGAHTYGAEFREGTLAGLLCQPVSRARIHIEKLVVLAGLLTVAGLNLLGIEGLMTNGGVFRIDSQLGTLVIGCMAGALCSAPLFTLLSRSTLAGAVFTLAAPGAIAMTVRLLLLGADRAFKPEESFERWMDPILYSIAPVYWTVTAIGSASVFRRLEVSNASGGSRSALLHPLGGTVEGLAGILFGRSATAHLIRKELRLHVVPWLVSQMLVGLWILWMVARWLARDPQMDPSFWGLTYPALQGGLLGALTLITTGAACVAEERELGTLGWQLTQPVTLRLQWRIKWMSALVVGSVLGVLLPLTLLGLSFGFETLYRELGSDPGWAILFYLLAAFGILMLSIYASSFSRSTMTATAGAAFLGGGLLLVLFLQGGLVVLLHSQRIHELNEQWIKGRPLLSPPSWSMESAQLIEWTLVGSAAGILMLGLVVLMLARRNAHRIAVTARELTVQLGCLGGAVLVVSFLAGNIHMELKVRALQAGLFHSQEEQLASMERTLEHLRGGSDEDQQILQQIRKQFEVPADASIKALATTILGERGVSAAAELNQLFGQDRRWRTYPKLARQYGLTVPSSK